MASSSQLAIRKTRRNYVRGAGVERKCKNCRWWYYEDWTKGHVCVNGDSEEVAEFTDAEFSCRHWQPQLEQDGDATWYME